MVHTPISGYRELSADELKLVNQMKEIEERVLRVLDTLTEVDLRWLAIGRTHIEQGFGAVNRAITKPKRIALPEDERPVMSPSSEERRMSEPEKIIHAANADRHHPMKSSEESTE